MLVLHALVIGELIDMINQRQLWGILKKIQYFAWCMPDLINV